MPAASLDVAVPQRGRFLESKQGAGIGLIIARLFRPSPNLARRASRGRCFPNAIDIAESRLESPARSRSDLRGRSTSPCRAMSSSSPECVGRLDFVPRRGKQAVHHVLAGVRRLLRDDLVEHRAEQIHVASRADAVDRAGGHFGGHIGRRAAHAARLRDASRLAETRPSKSPTPSPSPALRRNRRA